MLSRDTLNEQNSLLVRYNRNFFQKLIFSQIYAYLFEFGKTLID